MERIRAFLAHLPLFSFFSLVNFRACVCVSLFWTSFDTKTCKRLENIFSIVNGFLLFVGDGYFFFPLFRGAMAQYDLTAKVAPYLDRHLVFPLLEFLQDKQLYADDQILKAKIELLAKTNMVDYAMDIHKSLYHTEDVPQGNGCLYRVFVQLSNPTLQRFCSWCI
jgi:hypothetical protein